MACNYLWFLKSNSMLQRNAICHNPVWPGLFLGYMCDNDHDGCYKFGPRNTYDFIALILALFFSTWVFNFGSESLHTIIYQSATAIISCIGNVNCPCNYEQFEKVMVFTVTVFMMVAACFESVGRPKKTRMASGNLSVSSHPTYQ